MYHLVIHTLDKANYYGLRSFPLVTAVCMVRCAQVSWCHGAQAARFANIQYLGHGLVQIRALHSNVRVSGTGKVPGERSAVLQHPLP